MDTTRIGFLGFGEAGYAIASGLHEKEGVNSILAYDAMQDDPKCAGKLAEKRAAVHAEKIASAADLAAHADIIFVAIPSFCAFACAQNAAEGIRPGVVYVDVSTATSAEKRAEAELFAAKGALFVDGAMMGALPLERHQVHMMISGPGRERMQQLMAPYHMNLDDQGPEPGVATSIKFVRSVFTKGIMALAIEAMRTAQHYGIEDLIAQSIHDALDKDFDVLMARWLGSPVLHAKRRAHEMENVVASMEAEGLPAIMSKATKEHLEWLDASGMKDSFADGMPDDWHEILKRWPKA